MTKAPFSDPGPLLTILIYYQNTFFRSGIRNPYADKHQTSRKSREHTGHPEGSLSLKRVLMPSALADGCYVGVWAHGCRVGIELGDFFQDNQKSIL